MWATYFIACFFVVGVLYLPGCVVLGTTLRKPLLALSLAPAMSVLIYSVIEAVYCFLGVYCSALSVGIATGIVCLVILSVFGAQSRHRVKGSQICMPNAIDKRDVALFALYLIIGIAAVGLYFIRPLDGPNSFFQGWDNVHHLPAIQTYADSGIWNPLFSSSYAPWAISPYTVSTYSFYPSAWHILCASVMSALEVSATFSVNCVNAVLIGVVFPISMYGLLRTITNNDCYVMLFGSLIVSGVPACPWSYIIYGPLYPNLFAMVLAPIAMTQFILTLKSVSAKEPRRAVAYGLFTLLSTCSVALAHPNGVFTLIVFLAPYLTYWLFQELKAHNVKLPIRVCAIVAPWILIIVFWVICYHLPIFTGVVQTTWPSISSETQSLVDALLLSVIDHPAQIAIFMLLVAGVFYLFANQKSLWILAVYAACAVMYILDAGTDSFLKNWITGFWYTDYHRTGAMLGFAAILIAAIGAGALARLLQYTALRVTSDDAHRIRSLRATSFVLYLFIGIFIYIGSFSLKGFGDIQTAFGYQSQEFSYQNDFEMVYYDILTYEEQQFAEEALSLVPEDAVIINNPNDGSVFLYPLFDTDLYYRGCTVPSKGKESSESELIRLHLSEISSSPEVQQAVQNIGAAYVIQLDHKDRDEEFRNFYQTYDYEDWSGINNIDEGTPGFTLIYSENDMRLYRIEL